MSEDLSATPLAYRALDLLADSGLAPPDAFTDVAALGALQALSLIACFVIKHFVCDFVFQTNWQAANKGRYGHPASFVHSGQHVLGSAVVLFGIAPALYAILLAVEAVAHYHIDWLKDRTTRAAGLTPTHHLFWTGLGFDQLLHQLTYVAMSVVVILSL